VGNLREASAKRDEPIWFTYADWSRIYGDVFHLKVFGTRTIILNSYKAVIELFEKRSNNYSDRPGMGFIRALVSGSITDFLPIDRHADDYRLDEVWIFFHHKLALVELTLFHHSQMGLEHGL